MNTFTNPLIFDRIKTYYYMDTSCIDYHRADKAKATAHKNSKFVAKSDLKLGDIFHWKSTKNIHTIRKVIKITDKSISSKEIVSDISLVKNPAYMESTPAYRLWKMAEITKYDPRFLKGRTVSFKKTDNFYDGVRVYDTNFPIIDLNSCREVSKEYFIEYLIHGFSEEARSFLKKEKQIEERKNELRQKIKENKEKLEKLEYEFKK